MDITRALAENIVNATYEGLPVEVVTKTKKHILDTLGIMFPPSTLEAACMALEEIARETGGKPESTLIGFGGKVPCSMAAFVNGSLCHPMDYDDSGEDVPSHPSAHTFPAALAMAERVGNVTGREFITAVALGLDLNVRLLSSANGSLLEDYPWSPVSVFGVFSATAVAGKLLALSDQQMINAFGIAVDRASGITKSLVSPDSEVRSIRDAFGNREGVLAALMAQKGISACKNGIEILYKVFYNNNYDPLLLASNLGTEFWGLKVGFKAWPCCRLFHTHVKAALDIAKEHQVDPEKIEEVVVTVGSVVNDATCTPLAEKQRPRLSINAKISLPFVMGVIFAKKEVAIGNFLPENLDDPKVLEMIKRVKPVFDPLLPKGVLAPGTVEVRMRGGKSFTKTEHLPYGHSKHPMTDHELVAKFKDCALYSKKGMSEGTIARLVEKILDLEKVNNMREITELLA
jgi:2-methylcitrate dehydratase PrpD